MAKVIFGCGYLGRRVARLWREGGNRVLAVTRSAEKGAELAAEGIEPLVGDIVSGPPIAIPAEVRTVLFAVGYDRPKVGRSGLPSRTLNGKSAAPQGPARQAGPTIHDVYVGGLANAVAWLPENVERFLHISSTGVYGQGGGDVVDEASPCQPTRDGGQACLAAEELLRASRFASRSLILRLAGLYGPGRIPRAQDLLDGRPIDAPADGWLNLIHVDDAARIVLLAEERAGPPRTYVVSDGHFVQRRAYYEELARLLGAPPPGFTAPAADSPAAQRAASDKRVNPARLFRELQPTLLYPTYRDGLAAMVGKGE